MVHRLGKLDVAEVPWAVSLVSTTGLAELVSLACAHARVVHGITIGQESDLVIDAVTC